MENQKDKAINLAIRLNSEQYKTLKRAAKKAKMKVSTWMKRVSLAAAGDTRDLEELLKAVCTHIENDING